MPGTSHSDLLTNSIHLKVHGLWAMTTYTSGGGDNVHFTIPIWQHNTWGAFLTICQINTIAVVPWVLFNWLITNCSKISSFWVQTILQDHLHQRPEWWPECCRRLNINTLLLKTIDSDRPYWTTKLLSQQICLDRIKKSSQRGLGLKCSMCISGFAPHK